MIVINWVLVYLGDHRAPPFWFFGSRDPQQLYGGPDRVKVLDDPEGAPDFCIQMLLECILGLGGATLQHGGSMGEHIQMLLYNTE